MISQERYNVECAEVKIYNINDIQEGDTIEGFIIPTYSRPNAND